MLSNDARYLFYLAIALVLVAFYVGFSESLSAIIGAVNYTGRLFTGQLAPKQTSKGK